VPEQKRTAALDWDDVRHFVALAQQGTLSGAARALRVNHATVARRISSFESALGRPLFDRRPTGYVLTADGRAVLDEAAAMDRAALAVRHRLESGAEPAGLVRLTTIRSLADHFLIERLGPLHRRYGELDLEIISESRVMSLARSEADIALRLGQPRDSELAARRIGRIGFAFYAAPEYRKRMGGGRPPLLIGYDEDSEFVPEGLWLKRRFAAHRFVFRANSHISHAAAARAGLGIALLPRFLAARDPDLAEIAFGELPPPRDIWLLARPNLAKVPRVRVVADYLVELFRREHKLLAGS
jgi:DNA-binding transcriptional LysR family regulator